MRAAGLSESETGQLVAGPFVESAGFEALRIVDINGDGRNDVVGVGPGHSSVALLRQDANGTLVLESPIPLNAAGALDIEAGDVNGDGRPDLVVAIFDYPPQPRIAVLLQLSDGGFSPPPFLSPQPTPSMLRTLAVAIGDLNSDGRNDVVATSGGNSPSTTMAVFYQSNDGKLEAMTSIDTYEVPAAVRIADVNGDGRADVIVEHSGWFTFGVCLQQANAALAAEQRFEAPYGGALSPQVMAVGDVNRDGRSDVLIAGFVLLQRP